MSSFMINGAWAGGNSIHRFASADRALKPESECSCFGACQPARGINNPQIDLRQLPLGKYGDNLARGDLGLKHPAGGDGEALAGDDSGTYSLGRCERETALNAYAKAGRLSREK